MDPPKSEKDEKGKRVANGPSLLKASNSGWKAPSNAKKQK